MENQEVKIPMWYWVVAVFFLLWNLMGVSSFFSQMLMTDEAILALPQAEQDLYKSYPLWTKIVFAIAVFGGTIGCIGLLMKRKWSKMAFIISLLAIIPQMSYALFFTKTREVYGPESDVMPIMIVVGGIFLVWFANFCIRKGWLK